MLKSQKNLSRFKNTFRRQRRTSKITIMFRKVYSNFSRKIEETKPLTVRPEKRRQMGSYLKSYESRIAVGYDSKQRYRVEAENGPNGKTI